jgi:hypothetical protein
MQTFNYTTFRQSFKFGPGLLLLLAIIALQIATACDVGAEEQTPEVHISTAEQLRAAIRKDGIAPGTTIWLAKGSYTGPFVSELLCTATAPCTIRPELKSNVRLDGRLEINGGYTTWRDLEITDTSWVTRQGDNLSQAHNFVEVFGPGIKLINNVIHDLAGGIYGYNDASDNLWYGNIVFNNGYLKADGERVGHGFYLQNESGTKQIKDNVVINQYNFGIHAYGSKRASLKHLIFEGNIQLNNRWLIGGGSAAMDIHARNNLLYNSNMQFGYSNKTNEDVEIRSNYVALGTLQIQGWKRLDVQYNTIAQHDATVVTFNYTTPLTATEAITWRNNTYYRPTNAPVAPFGIDGEGFFTLSQWQARTNNDTTSALSQTMPDKNAIFVHSNIYDSDRATVTVYNWENLANVPVDLSNLKLKRGQTYELRNAQNYVNEWRTFVYAGASIAVPMNDWSVATPIGTNTPLAASTFPHFGVFVIVPATQDEVLKSLPGLAMFTTFVPLSQQGS